MPQSLGTAFLDVFTLGTHRLVEPLGDALLNPGKDKLNVPPPPTPPTEANQQAELARSQREEKQKRAFSNVFTSPAGALVPSDNLSQKKLFGQ